MTELLTPSPATMADAVVKELEDLRLFKDVKYKHGKFRIDDLDKISFRTPAAFFSFPSGDPEINHNGDIRLKCECAIMIVSKTSDRNSDPWELAVSAMTLVHRNTWGMKNTGQPSGFNIIPVISGAETKKNQALTALTWSQSMDVSKRDIRTRADVEVETKQGDIITPSAPPAPITDEAQS